MLYLQGALGAYLSFFLSVNRPPPLSPLHTTLSRNLPTDSNFKEMGDHSPTDMVTNPGELL